MAIDKAIDSSKLDREMLATANAIREKGKTEAAIPWEDETGYAAPILALKGGGDLNFSVVAYASEDELPETADENTIAVITGSEITSWAFSATEPEAPQTGMVWFSTDTTSPVEFNALKENGIQVYPLSAKQYDGNAWEGMTAKSYQGGEWVDWWDGTLYNAGDEYINITGGWIPDSTNTGTVTKNSASITLTSKGIDTEAVVTTTNAIDFTGWDTVSVNLTVNPGSRGQMWVRDDSGAALGAMAFTSGTAVQTLDVSSVEQKAHLTILAYTASTESSVKTLTFNRVWLERQGG